MSSKINTRKSRNFTCLDFPNRNVSLVYDNLTKHYDIYDHKPKVKKEQVPVQKVSKIWRTMTFITLGACIGALTALVIVISIAR